MAKYDIEYKCGHIETEQLYGKTSERERYVEWAKDNKLCPECYREAKELHQKEESLKAATANSEAGLPPLTGTEKQIAWAETIRAERIKEIDAATASYDDKLKNMADKNLMDKANARALEDGFLSLEDAFICGKEATKAIKGITSAHWWIDNRSSNTGHILVDKAKEIAKTRKEQAPQAVEAKVEATVRPESPKTETVAEIRALEKSVEVVFPEKREDFWQIIKKQLHFEWSGSSWKRVIKSTNGTPSDRAAEVGHKLLAAGLPIRIFNEETRNKAVSGNYEQECTRWVMARTSGQYQGWFAVNWTEMNDNLYRAARKLPGSKWDNPSVVVPSEQFEEVLDFAGMYGFKLSDGAQELVNQARKIKEAALVAHVVEVDNEQPIVPGEKPKKLAVPEKVEVADEFKD